MIFESHAHYDDEKFNEDRNEVIEALFNEGIWKIINAGANIESSLKSIELAKKYDSFYASVGVHPHDVKDMHQKDIETLLVMATYKKVVAIGEIGLDYYYENSPKEIQKLWFREQISIAKEIQLPIIVHSRDASKDTYDIIKDTKAYEVGGVVHCFSGSKETAKKYVDLGMYIGIGGVITFPKANKLKEVVEAIPIENILVETDCPYLSPMPNRGKRNDSRNIKYILEAVGNIKGIAYEEVERITFENGEKLFFQE